MPLSDDEERELRERRAWAEEACCVLIVWFPGEPETAATEPGTEPVPAD